MAKDQSIERFLEEASAGLGTDQVMAEEAAQVRYGRDTAGASRRICGAVKPLNEDQIIGIVKTASFHKVPLYPISTGNNWGYGGANPMADGCVVVDLSGMRHIDMDSESGVVTLEPGVTQAMLRNHLDRHAPDFLVPVTGAGPTCSIVGNALERGYGITPYADHFAAVMCLEAILPDGRKYRSPLAEMGAGEVDRSFKWSPGPYLDGLFSQGGFGIVTRMSIALAPKPECVQGFFFSLRDDSDLEGAVVAVRQILRELGSVVGSINLMNRHRVLSMVEPYPRDRLGPDGLITESALTEMARRNQTMAWTGAGALYGPSAVVAAARSIIRKRLSGVACRLVFLTESRVDLLSRILGWVPGRQVAALRGVLATVRKSLQIMAGAPSEIALPLAYWISGSRPPEGQALSPGRDGCGLIWYSPLVPLKPDKVRAYVDTVVPVCHSHGIEPLVTLTCLSDRCIDSTVPILYEHADAASRNRAVRCYDNLFEAGKAQGFLPYRATLGSMQKFTATPAPCWEMVSALKSAIDPLQIIAPGRYAP